jgi:hypothetical protein
VSAPAPKQHRPERLQPTWALCGRKMPANHGEALEVCGACLRVEEIRAIRRDRNGGRR